MNSKPLPRCSTVSPASSTVAATIRSGTGYAARSPHEHGPVWATAQPASKIVRQARDSYQAYPRSLATLGRADERVPCVWGHGRERAVTLLGGQRAAVRPRRARCTACHVTHVIVPAWCAPRRAHALEVIGTAAAAALAGSGHRAIGAGLGVPQLTYGQHLPPRPADMLRGA